MAEDDTDWQAKRDVLSCNRYMLENQVVCDVTFYVGKQKQEVKVHKYVLVSRSSIFNAMLCGPLHETGPINIPDIEPDVFKQLLSFIYFESFEPDGDSILALLYAAKKYAVKNLVDMCVNRLEKEISLDNVCDIIQQAHALDEKDLRRKCMDYIIDNGRCVLKQSSFRNLSSNCVEMVISHDELCAEEDEIYKALKHWAEAECVQRNIQPSAENMRHVLGGLKNLIRFSVMDGKYFADKVAADNILSVDEKLTFLRNFLSNCNLEDTKYTRAARKPRFQEMQRLMRFPTYGPASSTGSILHAIEFKCSSEVLLHGIILYGATQRKISCNSCGLAALQQYYCTSCGYVTESKSYCSRCGRSTLQYYCNQCATQSQSKNFCDYCGESGKRCHNCGCWQESFIPNEVISDTVVQLLDESKRIIISMKCQRSTSEKELQEVSFDDPVVLKKNWYTITLAISSSGTTRSGVNGEKVVSLGDGQSIEFRDSSLSATDTNVLMGQIPGLLLSKRR